MQRLVRATSWFTDTRLPDVSGQRRRREGVLWSRFQKGAGPFTRVLHPCDLMTPYRPCFLILSPWG